MAQWSFFNKRPEKYVELCYEEQLITFLKYRILLKKILTRLLTRLHIAWRMRRSQAVQIHNAPEFVFGQAEFPNRILLSTYAAAYKSQ